MKCIAETHGFMYFHQSSRDAYFGQVCKTDISLVNATSLIINETDCSWSLKVFGKDILKTCTLLKHLPDCLNHNSADLMFSTVRNAQICKGNPDFPDLITRWNYQNQNIFSHPQRKILV